MCERNNPFGLYLHVHNLEIAFKRATVVSKKHCLWVGLTSIILVIAFQRAAAMCKKQFLLVGLTCTILENHL